MTRRYVLATVGLVAAALVALLVPLAVAVRGQLTSQALDELQAQTEQVAVFIEDQAVTCGQVDLILAVASQERPATLSLFSREGQLVAAPFGERPTPGVEVRQAANGSAGRRVGSGHVAVAVPLSTDVCLQRLVLHAEVVDDALQGGIQRAWGGLGLVGLAVLALAAAAARLVAARLTRPLGDLAAQAARLGQGDFSVRVPATGLPEVDAIARTLDATAERLGRTVERGRAFAADAGHQLRTPMTALRLQLETLEAQGADPDTVRAALAEADRLEATVDELVALTALDQADEDVVVADAVREVVDAAAVRADAVGRRVELVEVGEPRVRVRVAAVRQAVQVLLDNALDHGQGRVTVTVAPSLPEQPGRGVRICVADEGPGLPAGIVEGLRARDRGSGGSLPLRGGRGLALARVLVEGEDGRLTVESDAEGGPVSRVCIVLPAAPTADTAPISAPNA